MAKDVCVIGCNGFVGANVAKQFLAQGYSVRGVIRHKPRETETWLTDYVVADAVDGAEFHLHTADPTNATSLEPIMQGCVGVSNCAGTTEQKPETVDIMRNIASSVCDAAINAGVSSIVFASSTGSTNPPEGDPPIKNEIDHWSDETVQLSHKKYAAAAKTVYDKTVLARMEASDGKLRCATINPSMIFGPNPQPEPDGSLKLLTRLLQENIFENGPPNSSMSLIHVEDLARMHVAALTNPAAKGRYFAVKQSWHWRDILNELGRQAPSFTPPKYDEAIELVTPTQFDFTRRDSLGVTLRGLPDIIASGLSELERRKS